MNGKLHNLLGLLDSALARLEDVLSKPQDEYMRDSAIQRFEFTFELFWKALRAHAEISGLRAPSPRDALRAAFELGLLEDDPRWFSMLDDRNLTSHTYRESTAEAIRSRLPGHLALMKRAALELGRRTRST